jgi:PAS domain S-box-containing protein
MDAARTFAQPLDVPPAPPRWAVELFGAQFANAVTGLGVTNADGAWLEANPALCALTGHDVETLTTLGLADVAAPEDRYRDLVPRTRLLAGEIDSYQLELSWQHADGSPRRVHLTVTASGIDHDDRPQRLAVQVHDVTAQRAAEDRARLLSDLVECSAEAIWARDGGGEIVYWNRAAAHLLGYQPAEVIGSAEVADLPGNRVAETARVLAIAAGGRSVGPLDTVRRHKDGHDVDVSLTVSPIHGTDGELLGFASVARDTTERRAAQDELARRADHLSELNAELHRINDNLKQVIEMTAHDLGQPLHTISGAIHQLARHERDRPDDSEADRLLTTISDSATQMRRLLDAVVNRADRAAPG